MGTACEFVGVRLVTIDPTSKPIKGLFLITKSFKETWTFQVQNMLQRALGVSFDLSSIRYMMYSLCFLFVVIVNFLSYV
jgi:hypothetical protein